MTEGAGVQANRLRTCLRTFFRWCAAKEQKLISPDADPTAGISTPVEEQARDRVLSDEEITAFWRATGVLNAEYHHSVRFGSLFRLLLLTAQRLREVAGIAWSELDADTGIWTIPGSRTKNGKPHIVHLSRLAQTVLKGVPRLDGHDLLFSRSGTTAASGFTRAKRQLDSEMLKLLPPETLPWVLHDLRRTATTIMAQRGIEPYVADKVLNHTAGTIRGVAAIYNRFEYIDQRRVALEELGRYVDALESSTPSLHSAPSAVPVAV